MTLRCTRRFLAGVALVVALAAPAVADAQSTTADQINALVDGLDYKHAHWGILVTELETGQVLYERNPDKLFAPASVTKLYSVAAALAELGPDYRFETPIYAQGAVDEAGNLDGSLVLVASGDLSLGGRTAADGRIAFKNSDHTYAGFGDSSELTEPDPLAGLNELARQVAAAGIKRVRGEVLVDDRLFETAQGTGSGPSRLTPIMVNDNLIDLVITPGEPGVAASVTSRPQCLAWQVDASVETVPPDGKTRIDVRSHEPGRIVVRGQIAAGRKPLVRIHEVPDAASFARSLLIEALARAGVATEASRLAANQRDQLPDRAAYSDLKRVALLQSPPFRDSARLILKVSHNLHASTLPLLLAAKHGQRTLAEGLRRQHDALAALGVSVDTISFGGAAGGDRADYVTPRATVELLAAFAKRPDFAIYLEALPVLGVDGTLASAVGGESPAVDKFQAKTGTLLWANVMNDRYLLTSKALAGYGTSAGGKRLALAIFVNQVHIANSADRERIGRDLGKLCEIIYQSL